MLDTVLTRKTRVANHIVNSFDDESFSDITVIVVDTAAGSPMGEQSPQVRYYLHRLVLSMSPYFRAYLARWWDSDEACLVIDAGKLREDVHNANRLAMSHIDYMFRYMYGSIGPIAEADAPTLLSLAMYFQMWQLAEDVAHQMSSSLGSHNVVEYLNSVSGVQLGAHAEAVEGACWQVSLALRRPISVRLC